MALPLLHVSRAHRIMTLKMFHRNYHLYRKNQWLAVQQTYTRRMRYSDFILQRLMDKNVCSKLMDKNVNARLICKTVNSRLVDTNNGAEQNENFTVSTRSFSSMKDDELVKSWMKKINEDFEKGAKTVEHGNASQKTAIFNSDDTSSISEKSSSDEENVGNCDVDELHTDLEHDLEKLEKLGFTTEEVIDLLKSTNNLDETSFEEDHENFDSEDAVGNSIVTNGMHDSGDRANVEKHGHGHNEKIEDSTNTMKDDWAVVTMKPEVKTDWSVLEIEDFVNIAETEPDVEEAWTPPVDLVRGETGVFNVEELVTVLRAANAQDVMTIRIPPELDFADYMVIVSGKSLRHMKAITADVKWIYKRKKGKSDKYLRVEGETSDWFAMDLGNIVLHIFMPAARELYDLETLWTVGAKFDPQCTEQQKDPYVFTVDDLPWLKELEQASDDSESSDSQEERKQSK